MTLHERIKAAIEQRLAVAQAATPGPWHISVDPDDVDNTKVYAAAAWFEEDGHRYHGQRLIAVSGEGNSNETDAEFIAANGPDRIIRDCAEDLWLLNDHKLDPSSSHLFCDPGCVGGDCRRCFTEYPCRQLRSLARRYDISTKDGVDG